jgi:hypothetical protein
MATSSNRTTWLERGDQLKCFPDRLSQARYFYAWINGDISFVLAELERIFTTVYKMPDINWLNHPSIIISLNDMIGIPNKYIEDWSDIDFSINLPNGEIVSPLYLSQDNSYNEILAQVTANFLFLSTSDKISTIKKWQNNIIEIGYSTKSSLSELVLLYTYCRILTLSVSHSQSLSLIVNNLTKITSSTTLFLNRINNLISAWQIALYPTNVSNSLLNLSKLRKCTFISDIDTYLANTTTTNTTNLMYYLRCMDLPI